MAKDLLDFGGTVPSQIVPSHLSVDYSENSDRIGEISGKKLKISSNYNGDSIDSVDNTRELVYKAVDTVLHGRELDMTYIRYYQMVENICRYRHIEQSKLAKVLYDNIDLKYQQEVKPQLISSLDQGIETGTLFLKVFEDYDTKLDLLTKIFLYIDRCYLLPHHSKQQIKIYGLRLFTDDFFVGDQGEKLMNLHISINNQARINEQDDLVDLSMRLSKLLIRLNVDGQLKLHHDLINHIITNYLRIRNNWTDSQTYFKTVLQKISYEISFWKDCGHSKAFLYDLLLKLKWNLIFYDFQNIIEDILPYIIQSNKELSILIRYCTLSEEEFGYNSMKVFASVWGTYIYNNFNDLITDLKQNSKINIINSIIENYKKFKKLTETKFCSQLDHQFEYEFRSGFNQVMNKSQFNNFIIQLLIKQCDAYFKQKLDIGFEQLKSQTLIIFKAINNKEEFILQYQRDLSRRLLLNKAYEDISEEQKLVNLMLDTIGENDISISLNHMFQDLQISKTYEIDKNGNEIDFIPLILEKKHWPDIPKMDDSRINLPLILQKRLDEFTSQFQKIDSRNSNKILDWTNYGLHQIVIEVEFILGIKKLILNLYQAIVVLLYEKKASYTFKEMIQSTGLEESLLTRILSSLIKSKIIVVINQDIYQFNYNLDDKSTTIKISLGKDSKEIKDKAIGRENNTKNRNDEVKSVIVKIMKNRRRLSMIELLNECFKILEVKGPIPVALLKSNIENLIENEYMKRIDRDSLEYIP